MPNYTITLYLGSNEEGAKLEEKLIKHCDKEKLSVSEYVKSLILKDLK